MESKTTINSLREESLTLVNGKFQKLLDNYADDGKAFVSEVLFDEENRTDAMIVIKQGEKQTKLPLNKEGRTNVLTSDKRIIVTVEYL